MGDFSARTIELQAKVGVGTLRGEVEVNQIYALIQHEALHFNHPRGGGPKYLIGPLLENAPAYLAILGEAVLDGGELAVAMAIVMEHLSAELDPAAPIDEDPNPIRLRRSGNPKVFDNGEEVYNRPSFDPREPVYVPRGPKPGGPKSKRRRR